MRFRGEGGNPPSEKMFPWGLILTRPVVDLDQTYTGGRKSAFQIESAGTWKPSSPNGLMVRRRVLIP